MTVEAALLAYIFAPIAMVLCLILMLFSVTRRLARWGLAVSVVVFLGTPVASQWLLDTSAQQAGFLNDEDRGVAKSEGIVDAELWAPKRDAVVTARPNAEDQKCILDVSCWAKRYILDASRVCSDAIERQARFDHRWQASRPDRFTTAIVHDNGAEISYLGDELQLQNGFGAWLPASYSCRYDIESKVAVDVQMYEGHLQN